MSGAVSGEAKAAGRIDDERREASYIRRNFFRLATRLEWDGTCGMSSVFITNNSTYYQPQQGVLRDGHILIFIDNDVL